MLVLHAAIAGDSLAIWGEVPFEAPAERRKGRPRKKPEIPPPPQCGASFSMLEEAMERGGITIAGERRTLIAFLPTVDGRPLPSSPLIGEVDDGSAATLQPWSIDAMVVDAYGAIDLLFGGLSNRRERLLVARRDRLVRLRRLDPLAADEKAVALSQLDDVKRLRRGRVGPVLRNRCAVLFAVDLSQG